MLHALPKSMITACILSVEINEDTRQILSLLMSFGMHVIVI